VDDTATLRYRVRLLDPDASKNTLLPTNGTTTLSYVDALGMPQSQNFDVPVVVYGVGTLTVAYEGTLPVAMRPPTVVHGPVAALYPTPLPFLFDGPLPEGITGFLLDFVTLTGTEIIDGQVVDWDLSAGTMSELAALTDGKITAFGPNLYALAVPAGDLTVTYHYDTPIACDITYHNVNGAANPNPATYTLLDTVGTGLALQGLTGRPGYTFTGWYADPDYTVPVTGIEPNALEDRDYWAKWGDGGPDNPDKPDTYTITYQNLNGATNPNPATYTIINTPLVLRTPVRAGYAFGGWYADAAYTTPVQRIDADGTGHRVFWARWVGASTYAITYHNVNGATNPNPTSYTVLDTAGTGLALQALTGRPGYTFAGWYADAAYTIPVTGIEPDGLEERDYWAKWGDGGPDNPNKPDKYTITYHGAGGAPNPNPTTYTIIDTPITLKPTADAYFVGWYADSNRTIPVRRVAEGTTGNLEFWALVITP
jgi:uncharacterized repeat protein (TIGR02543 family)